MNSKPAIIFDLGAVLIDWNPRYLYRKLFADEAMMERFFAETDLSNWNIKQDEGRSFVEAVTELSAQFPHYEAHIRAFHERWEEMMPSAIDATVEILAELREQDYDLYALSNWSAETYPMAYARFEFLQWFRAVVLSGEVKVCKPDSRIYAHLLSLIGRPAKECIFIDDSLANYKAAMELGFQSIHFQSAEQLRKALKAHLIT